MINDGILTNSGTPNCHLDLMAYGDPRCSQLGQEGFPKEPQLADTICSDIDTYEDLPESVPEICTNHIIPYDRQDFLFYYMKDNFDALTIKMKPDLWTSKSYCYHKLKDYCEARKISYYYLFENEESNLHLHGIFGFPNGKSRKLFQVWCNKQLGKLHQSHKCEDTNLNIWYDYIHGLVAKKLGYVG